MGVATTSLLDQSTDSQPEHSTDDDESSLQESIVSNGIPRTSLLDTVAEDEQVVPSQEECDTPRSLSGRKRRMEEPKDHGKRTF